MLHSDCPSRALGNGIGAAENAAPPMSRWLTEHDGIAVGDPVRVLLDYHLLAVDAKVYSIYRRSDGSIRFFVAPPGKAGQAVDREQIL
jgi:hypothetical protein